MDAKITAVYVRSDALYDYYRIYGIELDEETNEPPYHKELKGFGTTERDVEAQYSN